ncbi:MAG: orotidine-5'-phosphate decarboxylase [Brevinematales bacterium]|nr:orotidine-5'-phosphate decarboxylase [Brevinematales bacterium]
MKPNVDKIIVAIDVTNFDDFISVFDKTKDVFVWYKVHSIFLKEHIRIIDILKNNNKRVFLDLKFFDIPATVEKHIRAISKICDMFTVHLLSGSETLKIVSQVSLEENIIPVGISILTSFSQENLREIGINSTIEDEVTRLVKIGLENGINYFVCSPNEVREIKRRFPKTKAITPGIRISNQTDDQKRVMSPKEAFELGADYIVMGRDILRMEKIEKIFEYI